MKRFALRAGLALAALAVTAPLSAQGWNRDAFWRGAPASIHERIDFLQARIDRGLADHSINRREGMWAQNELSRVREQAQTMRARDGGTLNDTDRSYVQERLDNLSQHIHWLRHNDW